MVTGVAGGVILREQVYLNPALKKCSRKYWEIIADNLSKAGWELGLRFGAGFRRADDVDC